jgi:pimeloyl-ACP methyl ester carboxylesterase
MGAAVSLFSAGVYPEKVEKLVAIEGMKIPDPVQKLMDREIWELTAAWIEGVKEVSRRTPRRYATIDEAAARMQQENPHLSSEQARHLTIHGVARNEDGTFSWKFDNSARPIFPQRMDTQARARMWERITCPTLLVHGSESWHGDPRADGRASHIPHAEIEGFEDAGHWVHHDQLEPFLDRVRRFLRD